MQLYEEYLNSNEFNIYEINHLKEIIWMMLISEGIKRQQKI